MASRHHKQYQSQSSRAEERKQRYIKITVSLFMVFLMVFSTVAFFFTPDPNSFTYNGVRFRAVVDASGFIQGYTARIDGETRTFFSRPTDTTTLSLPEGFPLSLKESMMVVVLFNPEDNLTPLYDSFRFVLEQSLGATPALVPAVTQENTQYPFATYSCDQATEEVPVLFLVEGPLGITAGADNPHCITLSGSQYEYALLHDRIIYRLLEVTES